MDARTEDLLSLISDHLVGKHDLIGIEIGSFFGDSAYAFVSSNAFKTLYCIDPYEQNFDPNDQGTSDALIYAEPAFDKRFKDSKVVVKIKKKSIDAVDMFEDDSIDFIYIDGNHQYDFVKADIEHYYPKIKKGGIISGHDYQPSGAMSHIRGVKKAVDEFFKTPPLNNYCDNSWVYIKK